MRYALVALILALAGAPSPVLAKDPPAKGKKKPVPTAKETAKSGSMDLDIDMVLDTIQDPAAPPAKPADKPVLDLDLPLDLPPPPLPPEPPPPKATAEPVKRAEPPPPIVQAPPPKEAAKVDPRNDVPDLPPVEAFEKSPPPPPSIRHVSSWSLAVGATLGTSARTVAMASGWGQSEAGNGLTGLTGWVRYGSFAVQLGWQHVFEDRWLAANVHGVGADQFGLRGMYFPDWQPFEDFTWGAGAGFRHRAHASAPSVHWWAAAGVAPADNDVELVPMLRWQPLARLVVYAALPFGYDTGSVDQRAGRNFAGTFVDLEAGVAVPFAF